MKQSKFKHITILSILLLLISTVMPANLFSFQSHADETEARDDGAQRITADALNWTPVSEENPLGGADDFSAILFDEFKNFNETGGPIAAGTFNNVDIVTFEEGHVGGINKFNDFTIPRYNVGIIAQDVIENSVRVFNGDAIYGDNVDEESIEKTHPDILDEGAKFQDQAQIDTFMADAKQDVQKLNETLWSLTPTKDVEVNSDGVTLDVTEDVNVFELDANMTDGHLNINYDEALKDSTIIIKANSNNIAIQDTNINGEAIHNENIDYITNRIIWVFDPADSEVTLSNTEVIGSVIATNTNFTLKDGYSSINGTMVANGLTALDDSRNSEFHYTGGFMGVLPKQDPEEVEEVTPVNPNVEQAYCDEEGNPVDPTVTPAETDGITYEVIGDVEAGSTVTVVATPEEGYELTEAEGWTLNEDGTASQEVELEETNCEEEPEELEEATPVNPVVEQAYCDEAGNQVDPAITPAETDGITYEVIGDVEAGNTVTVVSTPEEGYELTESEGWTLNEDGTASQEIELEETNCEEEPEEVEEVTPEDPTTEQAYCDEEGNPVDPTVTPADTDGITYEVIGDVEAGSTVTIVATPEEGYELTETDGWELNEDGTASQEVVLEEVECEEAPEELEEVTPEDPTTEQAYCDEEGNPVDPTVTPAETDGITYEVIGDVEAGNTVTVVATPDEGYELAGTEGWTLNEDGTASQEIELEETNCEEEPEEVEEATPVNPVVEQAYCDEEGNPVGPTVTPAETDGITYAVIGDVEAGNTVTVVSTPEEGYELTEAEGWTLNEDGTASQEVVLEEVECEEAPEEVEEVTPEDPTTEQAYCDEEGNPVDPTVTPADTDGITYEVIGDVEAGSTVTIVATPEEGYELTETDGWVLNEDGTASKDIDLTETKCDSLVEDNEDNEVIVDEEEGSKLPKTATNTMNILLGGLVMILGGIILFSLRREEKNQTE